jgi:hypothetical protein
MVLLIVFALSFLVQVIENGNKKSIESIKKINVSAQ